MPPSPRATCRSARSSGTMLSTMPPGSVTSPSRNAWYAPSATSGATRSSWRSNTRISKPAFKRLRAIGWPIWPSPTNPITSFISVSFQRAAQDGVQRSSCFGVDDNTAPGFGGEDVVGERVGGHAVGLLHRGYILDPGASGGIDDRKHRAGRVREGSQVKTLIAPVVPHLVAPARLQDRCHDLTSRGADDHRVSRAAQQQFLVGRVQRDAARIAGGERVLPDELLPHRVNDRDGSTWILLVRGYREVEQVRLGIEH